ncbi:hypothetical protein [Candidatus Avelusimicrobium fimicolum]|jgi:hypothetical protein|uniref:hypothetical protein n=1 Tax=Candidatus Avelusimicrobium fimicolum TaxID=3416216 RepID=UPI003D13CE05
MDSVAYALWLSVLLEEGQKERAKTPFLAAFNRQTRPPLQTHCLLKFTKKKKRSQSSAINSEKPTTKTTFFTVIPEKEAARYRVRPAGNGNLCFAFFVFLRNCNIPDKKLSGMTIAFAFCRHPGKSASAERSKICCYKTRVRFPNVPRRQTFQNDCVK